jgi:ribonuclease HI
VLRTSSHVFATSLRSPSEKSGWIGYTLEYYKPGTRLPEILTDYEEIKDTTVNRAALSAAIRATKRLQEKCILTYYTESGYLYSGFAGDRNVDAWIQNDWKTREGADVKNADLWKELAHTMRGNVYRFYLREPNAYIQILNRELEELKTGTANIETIRLRHGRRERRTQ